MALVTLKLKNTKGGAITEISLDLAGHIRELKAQVEAATGIAPAHQRLIYTGKLLKKDEEPLAGFGFSDGDTILYMRMTAPASSAQAAALSQTAGPLHGRRPQGPRGPPAAATGVPNRIPDAATLDLGPRSHFTEALERLGRGTPSRSEAVRTLGKIMDNIMGHPHEAKYRTLKKANAVFHRRLGGVEHAAACLEALGFRDIGEAWELTPSAQAWEVLSAARDHVRRVTDLENAMRSAEAAGLPPGAIRGGTAPGPNPTGFEAAAAAMGLRAGVTGRGTDEQDRQGYRGTGEGRPGGDRVVPGLDMDIDTMAGFLSDPNFRNQLLTQVPLMANLPPAERASIEAFMADPEALRLVMNNMTEARMQEMMNQVAGQQAGAGGGPNPLRPPAAVHPNPLHGAFMMGAGAGANAQAGAPDYMAMMRMMQQIQNAPQAPSAPTQLGARPSGGAGTDATTASAQPSGPSGPATSAAAASTSAAAGTSDADNSTSDDPQGGDVGGNAPNSLASDSGEGPGDGAKEE